MFSYQCRYCKVTFDQWERLVGHRRDEHWQELEALKNELFLRKRGKVSTEKEPGTGTPRSTLNGLSKLLPFTNRNKMKPTRRTFPNARATPVVASPIQKTPSKEVDAKDLENREISLCVPASRNSSNGISFESPPQNRLYSTFPYPTPTPRATPSNGGFFQNGGVAGESTHHHHHRTPYVLTPPATPSPSTLSGGELVLNLKWDVPLSKKAILYHQIDDEAEIEFCTIPSTSDGSRVSLTRHSNNSNQNQDYRAMNGHGHHFDPAISQRVVQGVGMNSGEVTPSPSRRANHVIIERLEDELHMTCSSREGSSNRVRPTNETVQRSGESTNGSANNPAVMKPSEVPRSSGGKPLKRLHSELHLENRKSSQSPLPVVDVRNNSNSNGEGCNPENQSTNAGSRLSGRGHRKSATPPKAKSTSAAIFTPRASRRRPNN